MSTKYQRKKGIFHMATRLILLEGVPCTGKTSTARFVSSQLRGWHPDVKLFTEEATVHPVEFTDHAFLTPWQYKAFPEEDRVLFPAEKTEDPEGYIVPLYDLHESLRAQLEPYKIYGCQPWEVERPLLLNRWRQFVAQALQEETIYIFDGVFFQNPICEMMMWFDLPREEIDSFMKELADIIRPLSPLVIYLESDQIEARIREVSAERDYDWLLDLIAYHTGQGFGEKMGVPDMEGCILCIEARQSVELELLGRLGLDHLILENPFLDWVESCNLIRSRLREITLGKVSLG
jgi:hypothetical protein